MDCWVDCEYFAKGSMISRNQCKFLTGLFLWLTDSYIRAWVSYILDFTLCLCTSWGNMNEITIVKWIYMDQTVTPMSMTFHKILEDLEDMRIKREIFSLGKKQISLCFPLGWIDRVAVFKNFNCFIIKHSLCFELDSLGLRRQNFFNTREKVSVNQSNGMGHFWSSEYYFSDEFKKGPFICLRHCLVTACIKGKLDKVISYGPF